MNILISADSTCDLNPGLLSTYHIALTPLYVIFGDEAKKDGAECSAADILAYTERTGQLCSTSAVSIADYADFFAEMCGQYDAVIHFTISSELSSCYRNACAAAGEYPNRVFVVDSLSVSSGTGIQAIRAAEDRDRGLDAEEIYRRALSRREKVYVFFVSDSLDYLRKGGRCSAVAALGANMLKIKPCIETVNGKLEMGKKYRGTLGRVLKEMIRDCLQKYDVRRDMVFVTHNVRDYGALSGVLEELKDFERIEICPVGATVVSHCGGNTLGIIVECRK